MQRRDTISSHGNNTDVVFDGNHEFLERFDSRGKKMKIRRGQIT